jgi:hypothetical protein
MAYQEMSGHFDFMDAVIVVLLMQEGAVLPADGYIVKCQDDTEGVTPVGQQMKDEN